MFVYVFGVYLFLRNDFVMRIYNWFEEWRERLGRESILGWKCILGVLEEEGGSS